MWPWLLWNYVDQAGLKLQRSSRPRASVLIFLLLTGEIQDWSHVGLYIFIKNWFLRTRNSICGESDQRVILASAVIQFSFPFFYLPNPDLGG